LDNKNKKNPRNIIAQVDKILRRNDIMYWLEAGTALSAVRDGKI
jgi:LICD Protein Family.